MSAEHNRQLTERIIEELFNRGHTSARAADSSGPLVENALINTSLLWKERTVMIQATRLFASLTGLASRPSHARRSTSVALPLSAVLTLILTLASLTFAESTFAQGQRIVLTGTDQRFFGVPAKQFVAGGWTQVRDVPLTGTFAFRGAGVVLAGSESQLDNAMVDANGNGWVWGRVTFTDVATRLTCTGPLQGKLTNFAFSGSVVARCSDGSLLTGTLHDTAITPFVEADARFDGVLLK